MITNNLITAASFTPKSLQSPDAWVGHLPFAAWVIREVAPKIFVELGTHSGNSYFAFCQSVVEAGLLTKCFAIDTWNGDEHAGYYGAEIFSKVNAHNLEHYAGFSQLLRMTFDDALACFADESIDLLHIDGLHTYEAVCHDFETWLPKLAPGAVVLFHDTNVHERGFGVWKFWKELQASYPKNIEFSNSNGLGVLQLNSAIDATKLIWLYSNFVEQQQLKDYFFALGAKQLEQFELGQTKAQIASLNQVVTEREHALHLARQEFFSVINSISWKMTWPLRYVVRVMRLLLTRSRLLLMRARIVIRQEGMLSFFRRTNGYLTRQLQRKAARHRLERFLADNENSLHRKRKNIPLVSFVIPIYDRTDFLRKAVRSVLAQSAKVFEVILVTDGSPAETLAVVNEFRSDSRIRIFNYPVNSGNAVRGRNKGILEARGRYIAFLDSDDIAAPDRLEVCLPLLESDKADVVYGDWRALLDGSREVEGLVHGLVVHSPDCDLAMLQKNCVPCLSTVIVRRELLMHTGFFKTRMKYREDHELWIRLAYHGARFKAVPQVLTDLRLHAGNNELNFKLNDAYWASLVNEEYRLPGPKPQKIAFLLASLGISGGVAVVLKHVSMLMEQGHDAFIINLSGQGNITWYGNPTIRVYDLDEMVRHGFDNIDLLFATFWTTVEWLEKIPARRKLYFVQADERLLYEDNVLKAQVDDTYRRNYEYVAIAQWLVTMLRTEFGQSALYVPNGLDTELFYPDHPMQAKNPQRPRVLIEGPISVPFKGVSQSYEAVSALNCELWIVSSNGRPEQHWRYDRFFEGADYADMRRIYSSCDVLLKMSRVESFAYPVIEAMACGCAVVLGDVDGDIEYADDGKNVLKVAQGDVRAARVEVLRLFGDIELRDKLVKAGFSTVKLWSWEKSKKAMLDAVESSAAS